MSASSLDLAVASVQTREMQRDAHLRLGACVFVALWAAGWITATYDNVGVPFYIIGVVAGLIGIGVGWAACRRGVKITARLQEEDRAAREADKAKQIAEMLKAQKP